MRPELFDFSRNPHRESTTMSVGYAVQKSDAQVRSPPKVRPTVAVQYDRFTLQVDGNAARCDRPALRTSRDQTFNRAYLSRPKPQDVPLARRSTAAWGFFCARAEGAWQGR
jgi:hypothetical protein